MTSGLLRQPGGFEGFSALQVCPRVDGLPVLELDHSGDWRLGLGTARFATCTEPPDSDDSFANVADVRVIDADLGKHLVLVSEPLANALVPAIHRCFPSQQCSYRRMPLHVGVEVLQHRLDVPAVGRVSCALEGIDVLLRHRLLRQPGGFEGFLPVEVVVDPDDLSVAHGADLRELKLRHRPATRAPTVLAGHGDHPIPSLDHFSELDLPLLKRERLEPIVLEESLDRFVAAIGTESGDAAWGGIPNDLWGPDAFADAGVHSPPVEGLECSADHLHVLFRHRPRSISRPWT